jgi:hypothetical protein
MALPIDRAGFEAAWRALAGAAGEGWRGIPVASIEGIRILAGRRFPGNEEAVLFGMPGYKRPPSDQLPSGRGFDVVRVSLKHEDSDLRWIGISRQRSGSLDLFILMITDLISHVGAFGSASSEERGSALLSRIRAWQDFMQRGDGVLGPEAEVGLVGELQTVLGMIDAGVAPAVVVAAWRGPLDGLHDFVFPGGAIEVKSSIASEGFLASVASLEQLDDSKVAPLLLAAVRLAVGEQGHTLPELVQSTRTKIGVPGSPSDQLEVRLLHAGYSDRFAERYVRRFSYVSSRAYVVDAAFPRLVRSAVPASVRQVRYDLDLEMIGLPSFPIEKALAVTGAV